MAIRMSDVATAKSRLWPGSRLKVAPLLLTSRNQSQPGMTTTARAPGGKLANAQALLA